MNNQPTYSINNTVITPEGLRALEMLQQNNNEALNEHIMRLANVSALIGTGLDGFDPNNPADKEALRSIVSISHVIVMLQQLAAH